MFGSSRGRQRQTLVLAGLALYAVFLLTAPFTHHDLLCHFKTPLHCTSCASSHVGSDPHTTSPVGAWTLQDAGCAFAPQATAGDTLLALATPGRSPPSRG